MDVLYVGIYCIQLRLALQPLPAAGTPLAVRSSDSSWINQESFPLISDERIEVIHAAMYALSEISQCPEGALAVVNANMKTLESTLELLTSPVVRLVTCIMLGHLALQRSTAMPVLGLRPSVLLVSLLK